MPQYRAAASDAAICESTVNSIAVTSAAPILFGLQHTLYPCAPLGRIFMTGCRPAGRRFKAAAAALICALAVQSAACAQDSDTLTITLTGYDNVPTRTLMPGEQVMLTAGFASPSFTLGIIHGSITGDACSVPLLPRLVMCGPGYHETGWAAWIPAYGIGTARADVRLARLFRGTVAGSKDVEIQADLSEYTGPEGCSECHEENYKAWMRNRHAPIPACEACHGPGRRHDEADTEEFIFMDVRGKVCVQCHVKNAGTYIEAEDGFIAYYQEHNEINRTAHGRFKHCTVCHNPHYSTKDDRRSAIRTDCRICHPGKRAALHPATVRCEDCHMPKAALRDASRGTGLYRVGDFASHIMRINIAADAEDMFTADGTVLAEDGDGPFLTLNFACLACHNGSFAGKADMQAARNAARLIHAR